MRIAHCQFEPWCGDFERNLQRFDEGLKRVDASRGPDHAFGLTKSAWSFRESGAALAEAAKDQPPQ